MTADANTVDLTTARHGAAEAVTTADLRGVYVSANARPPGYRGRHRAECRDDPERGQVAVLDAILTGSPA